MEGRNICCAKLADIGETTAAPAERLTAEPLDQKIGDQPRMTPVAVRKGMDGDEPVVQPDSDFVWWIGIEFHPKAHVIK